jgi:cytoskeletal protein CcmA (bactofilin family)
MFPERMKRLTMLSISRLFRKKPKKFYSSSAELFDSIVGEGTEVHGRIVARKSIRIDGSVYGSVEIPEGERNITVAIGVNGKVFGDIKSYRVLVAGLVEGKIYATERVELRGQASVKGDITYNDIGIEPGAQLVGFVMKRVGKKNETADAENVVKKFSKLEVI